MSHCVLTPHSASLHGALYFHSRCQTRSPLWKPIKCNFNAWAYAVKSRMEAVTNPRAIKRRDYAVTAFRRTILSKLPWHLWGTIIWNNKCMNIGMYCTVLYELYLALCSFLFKGCKSVEIEKQSVSYHSYNYITSATLMYHCIFRRTDKNKRESGVTEKHSFILSAFQKHYFAGSITHDTLCYLHDVQLLPGLCFLTISKVAISDER